ncbi:scavenger receptor cysteine-rich type 1 protein M130-like [Anneissia japonica]|uniref:scavenger receptor cysteine-rich type 1 protein M130-like n=1 Tax=Anneissia japonica TaxID=1529436 RepID=UPI0014259197|nr:scavenger receptor cysteine-rich type 1 protein M130-like [Anneissia japonica]
MSSFKFCICIILGFVITSKRVSGGQVRFRDGFSSTSGRVEVKPSSGGADWGNICSDDFDIIDADVICRQLDYAWALYVYNVSEYVGTKPAAISNLECDGNETNIFDCEHEGYGTNMCEGVPGVGVICIDLEYADLVPVKNLRIRTTGGDDTSGKLEIFDNDNWGKCYKYICINFES